MPRSTKSRSVQEDVNGEVDEYEDEETTESDTDEENDEELDGNPGFTFSSEPAPKDFQPDRKTPGRIRQPSYFDDVLRKEDVFDTGKWQRIPVDGDEHADAALRELNRSKLHLNKQGLSEGLPEIGLDLDVRLKSKGADEDAVYFRSRTAQKRERKGNGNGNGNGSTNGAPVDVADDEDEYEDETDE